MGGSGDISHSAEYIKLRPCKGLEWNTRQMESKTRRIPVWIERYLLEILADMNLLRFLLGD